jgi:hypothetical protein
MTFRSLFAAAALVLLGAPAFAQSLVYDVTGDHPTLGSYTGLVTVERTSLDTASVVEVELAGTLETMSGRSLALRVTLDYQPSQPHVGQGSLQADWLMNGEPLDVSLELTEIGQRLEGALDGGAFRGVARVSEEDAQPTVATHTSRIHGRLPGYGPYEGTLSVPLDSGDEVTRGVVEIRGRLYTLGGVLGVTRGPSSFRARGVLGLERFEDVRDSIATSLDGIGTHGQEGMLPHDVEVDVAFDAWTLNGTFNGNQCQGRRVMTGPAREHYDVKGTHPELGAYEGRLILETGTHEGTPIRGALVARGELHRISGTLRSQQHGLGGVVRLQSTSVVEVEANVELGSELLVGSFDGHRVTGVAVIPE